MKAKSAARRHLQPARRRLVFISSVATPTQIGFCYALQPYFDAEFWFYEQPDRTRGAWWRTDLGEKCRIIPDTRRYLNDRYVSLGLRRMLAQFNPDIVMIGGFSIPGNYLAYRWARAQRRQTIVLTERSRNRRGELRGPGPVWRALRWLYRDVDLVMVTAEDIVEQFRDELGFGERVAEGRYPADLEACLSHPLREAKPSYTFLFANRLIDIYNPLGCLDIFAEVHARHPGSRLLMNAAGELRDDCAKAIGRLGLQSSVEFLTGIKSWDTLHEVYARSDILLLPARFSNGNFTILEAMASGMGLVVSDRVLGSGQLVEDGRNGFKCKPDTRAFVERIERYITDPGLFQTHSAINRKLVQPFSQEGTARFFADTVARRLKP